MPAYEVPPNVVKAAVLEALRNSSRILQEPLPIVELLAFDASAITYLARFWVYDYEHDDAARDEARTAIYYAFQRHSIEIPWPIQVEYSKEVPHEDLEARTREQERLLSTVDLLAPLSADVRQRARGVDAADGLRQRRGDRQARGARPIDVRRLLRSGSRRARTGAPGDRAHRTWWVFRRDVAAHGRAALGDRARRGDVSVIEIGAELFRRIAAENPHAMEQIGMAAVARRAALERIRTATAGAVTVETNTLLARMKKFLGFGGYSG